MEETQVTFKKFEVKFNTTSHLRKKENYKMAKENKNSTASYIDNNRIIVFSLKSHIILKYNTIKCF